MLTSLSVNKQISAIKEAELWLDSTCHDVLLLYFSLPKSVKRRIKALKKLQAAMNDVESKFFEEVHQLECKYAAQYEPFLQKVYLKT